MESGIWGRVKTANAPSSAAFEPSFLNQVQPPQTANASFFTLSSRRRSNATEKGAFVSKGLPESVEGSTPLCGPQSLPHWSRLTFDTRLRRYSG